MPTGIPRFTVGQSMRIMREAPVEFNAAPTAVETFAVQFARSSARCFRLCMRLLAGNNNRCDSLFVHRRERTRRLFLVITLAISTTKQREKRYAGMRFRITRGLPPRLSRRYLLERFKISGPDTKSIIGESMDKEEGARRCCPRSWRMENFSVSRAVARIRSRKEKPGASKAGFFLSESRKAMAAGRTRRSVRSE